jgi:hypothetical protein
MRQIRMRIIRAARSAEREFNEFFWSASRQSHYMGLRTR